MDTRHCEIIMTTEYKTNLFNQGTINAMCLTGISSFLMHPFVMFGYKFPDLGFLAWFYLVPLLLGMHRYSLKRKLLLCFLTSLIAQYGQLYWLMNAMQVYGGLNFFTAIGTLTLMFVIFGFLFAIFLSFAGWVWHLTKIPLFIILPVFMVAHDWALHYIPFGGYPWAIAPYSQGQWISFFQWVDYTGVLGLGFFIYLVNGLFAEGILLFVHRRQLDKMVSRLLIVVVLVFVSLYLSFLSSQNFEKNKTSKGNLSVALIQGNIPQDVKWDPYKAQDVLNVYLKLTNTAIKDGAELVIWPETSYPYGFRYDKLTREKFLDKEQLLAPILFGAIVGKREGSEQHIYNSVIHAGTDAGMKSVYNKMHLVPFGEYLPAKKLFGFLESLTQGVGEFTEGASYTLFDVYGFKIGSLICVEDIFPDNSQIFSKMGADLLVNYTNDAWYGDTSAQHQHVVYSQFRALENRRYLVRATNTGVTAVINPRGEVIDSFAPFKEGFLLQNLKLDKLESGFVRHGQTWVLWVAGLCAVLVFYTVLKIKLGPVKRRF